MLQSKLKKYAPLVAGLISFGYYYLLSAKSYTWMFMSSDSGDWLMTSNWWVVPQPYGSPLWISLMRLIGSFTDGNTTVVVATIFLSALPAAIAVTLVYLIVLKLTNKVWCAATSSLVLLGAGIFLTQATVLEQYVLAIMFLTLAYWCYVNERKKLTALCLGLGTAVHIFILPITVFWLLLEYKQWKLWLKPAAIFVATGILPYLLILVLMHLDTPRLIAGSLSFAQLWRYLTETAGAVAGTLSVFDTPERILNIAKVLLSSLGLALIPLGYGLKRPVDTKKLILILIVGVSLWYHLTSLDPITWTFMSFGLPSTAVLVGMGLNRLKLKHSHVVAVGALVLIAMNGVFLNANILTNERPLATTYYNELMGLPNHSVVVTTAGAYSLGLFYVMSEGKDLIPLIFPYAEDDFEDYLQYLKDEWNIEGNDIVGLTQNALDGEYNVYFAGSRERYWRVAQAFKIETGDEMVHSITGLSGLRPADVGWTPR